MQQQRFPIILGTCLDAEAIWLGKAPENAKKPVLLSHGTYAVREGLQPFLDLLDAHGVQTTFFVPGITAERYPDATREIFRRGHEIAGHGHNHLSPPLLDAEREKYELVHGLDTLERVTGRRPVSWRSPSWEFTERTIPLLLDAGVSVSTNFHDASRPYRHVLNGAPIDLVELPVEWHLADATFFLHGGMPGRVVFPPRLVEEMWREDFVGLYERGGCFFHLTLHVQLIGHPGRLRMLDRLLHFMKAHPGAYFTRCDELAATVS